jgi:regulator of sirC expression with transglutaminase-like and TPR domain
MALTKRIGIRLATSDQPGVVRFGLWYNHDTRGFSNTGPLLFRVLLLLVGKYYGGRFAAIRLRNHVLPGKPTNFYGKITGSTALIGKPFTGDLKPRPNQPRALFHMKERERQNFRRLFASQIQRPEEDLELDLAALYLAGEEYPLLDVRTYRSQLDSLAAEVRNGTADGTNERSLVDALNRHLFEQAGFTGNTDNYYSAENNYLNRVLDTHTGIPVILSLIYLEIGKRLGIRCQGVGLPGHFLVRLDELDLYLDPFNKGQLLSAADCRRVVRDLMGHYFPWREEYLAPYSKRDILYRILNNLKGIYFHARDYPRATGCLERIALIRPSASYLNRDLCWCYANTNQYQSAIHHLELYLQSTWPSQGFSEFRDQVESLWSAITHIRQQSG